MLHLDEVELTVHLTWDGLHHREGVQPGFVQGFRIHVIGSIKFYLTNICFSPISSKVHIRFIRWKGFISKILKWHLFLHYLLSNFIHTFFMILPSQIVLLYLLLAFPTIILVLEHLFFLLVVWVLVLWNIILSINSYLLLLVL